MAHTPNDPNQGSAASPDAAAATADAAATGRDVARRSRAEEAEIVRAKKTKLALPALLPGIAKADASAAKVRIDKGWVAQYGSIIASAQKSSAGRAVARADLRAATVGERKTAVDLVTLLLDVRERIATHHPKDPEAQKVFGRGERIDAKRTGPAIALAGSFVEAYNGQWGTIATEAGVTQAMVDQIATLRDALSNADMGQHGVVTTNVDGTMNRSALFAVLRSMSAFAVRVVHHVYGRYSKEALSLDDPRPLTSKKAKAGATSAKKPTKRAKAQAKAAAKAAAKKAGALPKRTSPKARARSKAVATRKTQLAALAAKAASKTRPKKSAPASAPKAAKRARARKR